MRGLASGAEQPNGPILFIGTIKAILKRVMTKLDSTMEIRDNSSFRRGLETIFSKGGKSFARFLLDEKKK